MKLKPCLFCDSEDVCFNHDLTPDYVTCLNCGADGPLGDPTGSKWNAAAEKVEKLESLVIHSVDAIMSACGNSYSNSYTQNWLEEAKSLGLYDGKTTGKIQELSIEWSYWLDTNGGLPEIKKEPKQ